MILYASRTGTRRNLAELRRNGWRLLVSATGCWRNEGFRYAIDNGAWTAYQRGEPWDEARFIGVLDAMGEDADWVALPDIVCGGEASLEKSLSWIDRIPYSKLLPVQDGFDPAEIEPHLSTDVGLFVGGSTEWKEESMDLWGELARKTGCYLHIARVNSARRIRLAALAGANSIDGTSATRFAVTCARLTDAAKQMTFRW